jgi:hypothetical protein
VARPLAGVTAASLHRRRPARGAVGVIRLRRLGSGGVLFRPWARPRLPRPCRGRGAPVSPARVHRDGVGRCRCTGALGQAIGHRSADPAVRHLRGVLGACPRGALRGWPGGRRLTVGWRRGLRGSWHTRSAALMDPAATRGQRGGQLHTPPARSAQVSSPASRSAASMMSYAYPCSARNRCRWLA